MTEFLALSGAVVPVFAIIGAGCLLRRCDWLTEDADHSLLKICINLLIPALIIDSILGNPRLRQLDNLLLPPLIGFAASTACIGFGWLVSRWSGAANPSERRTFALTSGLQNYLYYALPLTALLFDSGTVGVLFVHNLGVEVVLWTVGVAVLSGQGLKGGWRGVFNAPIIALVCSVCLNLALGQAAWLRALLPPGGPVLATAHTLGQCAVPLALLLTGAILADHLHELRHAASFRMIPAALLVRFAIAPILYLLIARCLPCSVELKRVLMIQGTLPSAMFPILMTRRYGGDSRVALQVVLATTIASLVMVPIWLRIGAAFLRQ